MNFNFVKALLLFSIFFAFSHHVSAQSKANESFFSLVRKVNTEGTEIYLSNFDLKKYRKFGIGISVGGANGLLGLNGELNVEPENAFVFGLGTGPSYGSFDILWKRNFEAEYLSPYFKFGYSKWFSTSSNTFTAGNSDVLKRVLTAAEIKSNRFNVDFLISSIGVEYNQLEGELAGVNFFGELVLMADVGGATAVPSGSVGLTYFY